MVGFIERIANRLKLPEWVVGLALVFAVDAVLAGVIVAGVASMGGKSGGLFNSGPEDLKDINKKYVGLKMEEVLKTLGPADGTIVGRSWRVIHKAQPA